MKHPDLLIGIGLIILSISMLLKYLFDLPDFISWIGILIGLGIELYGAYLYRIKPH